MVAAVTTVVEMMVEFSSSACMRCLLFAAVCSGGGGNPPYTAAHNDLDRKVIVFLVAVLRLTPPSSVSSHTVVKVLFALSSAVTFAGD